MKANIQIVDEKFQIIDIFIGRVSDLVRVSRGVLHLHGDSLDVVDRGVEEGVVLEPVPVLGSRPLDVEGGVVSAGQVGDHRAGGARDVRHEGQLLAGGALVLPGECFQPHPVVAVRL